jgi:hypothetical protein
MCMRCDASVKMRGKAAPDRYPDSPDAQRPALAVRVCPDMQHAKQHWRPGTGPDRGKAPSGLARLDHSQP